MTQNIFPKTNQDLPNFIIISIISVIFVIITWSSSDMAIWHHHFLHPDHQMSVSGNLVLTWFALKLRPISCLAAAQGLAFCNLLTWTPLHRTRRFALCVTLHYTIYSCTNKICKAQHYLPEHCSELYMLAGLVSNNTDHWLNSLPIWLARKRTQ